MRDFHKPPEKMTLKYFNKFKASPENVFKKQKKKISNNYNKENHLKMYIFLEIITLY